MRPRLPDVTTHAILFDDTRTKILLILWRNPLGQKIWSFPGGHIEVGEEVKEAVKREVREETGYDIKIDRLLGVYDNIVRDATSEKILAHVVNIVWIGGVLSGKLDFQRDEDVIRAEWFHFERAKKLRMSPTAKKILLETLRARTDTS